MVTSQRLLDAAAALIFDRSDVRRHLVLHHPGDLERARSLLRLQELRDRRAAPGEAAPVTDPAPGEPTEG